MAPPKERDQASAGINRTKKEPLKERCAEGVVTHSDPESWSRIRKDPAQALTGALADPDIDPRKRLPDVDPVSGMGNHYALVRHDERQDDPARSKSRGTSGTFGHENRLILRAPAGVARLCRMAKVPTRIAIVNALGKSDEDVVTLNHRRPTCRGTGEGRSETPESPHQSATSGAQDPRSVSDRSGSGCERQRDGRGRCSIPVCCILADRYLSRATVLHPLPSERLNMRPPSSERIYGCRFNNPGLLMLHRHQPVHVRLPYRRDVRR